MKRVLAAILVLAIVGMAALAYAADTPSPTGTWKWTMKFGERSRDVTLKLKLEGDTLTGSISGRDKDSPIQDAKFKDGELSFKVVRERNNVKVSTIYTGKLSGDTITGKAETERDGKKQSRDWEAKRVKE